MRIRPVYFQHLEKTGGTSVLETLGLFFHQRKTAARPDLMADLTISDALQSLRAFDFVHSHSEILSTAPDDAMKFTIFRDPLSRLKSARRQYMQAGDENLAAAGDEVARTTLALRDLTLVHILRRAFEYPRFVSGLWNHQALILGGWPLIRKTSRRQNCFDYGYTRLHVHFESGQMMQDWLTANKSKILSGAEKSLRSLSYIGLTEELDASLHEIFARIGLPEPGEVVVRNARQPFPDENDPALPEAAGDFLELDYELYALARERYDLQRRVARGMPIDPIGRWLSSTGPSHFSSRDPPGGHGWYPAHLRSDGAWARWTGPDLVSRFAASAQAGRYKMTLEVYGAISSRSLQEISVAIDGNACEVDVGLRPTNVYTVTVTFVIETTGRFDIVLTVPDVGSEHGLEIKEFTFEPLTAASIS